MKFDLNPYKRLTTYFDRIAKRKAVQTALAKEQINSK